MKKIIYLTLTMFVAIGLNSCSDDLSNYNENPNEPDFVLTNTIFNGATKQYTDFMRNDFNSGRLTLPWMQYWGQNSYADEDRYLYRETSAESIYTNSYLVATEFKSIIDLNVDPATSEQVATVGNNNNQIAASRIMLSYIFHKLTDTFGDVPYYSYGSDNPNFQALNIDENLSPVFATQEEIYMDILKELREASDMIVESESVFISGDNIFQGDAVKWKKFANSLILRVANRLREVDPGTANQAINEAIAAGVFDSNADNAIQPYETADATASPFWIAFIDRTDFAVAAPFVDLLKGETGSFGPDPRLFEMAAPINASINDIKNDDYEESSDYEDYIGVPYAFVQANSLPFISYSFPSSKVLRPDYGEVFMEYAEVAFILSEHNNWDQTQYENGVRASMERWGVASGEVDDFVSNLPAATEETVLNQKYVALYMQPHESWAEFRRTGFPSTLLLPGDEYILPPNQAAESEIDSYVFEPGVDINTLPFRIAYPVVLQTLNGSNRADAVSGLENGDTIFSPLFWDVNN